MTTTASPTSWSTPPCVSSANGHPIPRRRGSRACRRSLRPSSCPTSPAASRPGSASLFGLDAAAIADRAGVDTVLSDRIAQLLAAATAFAFQLDEAEQSGLRVVASVDDDYPHVLVDRLGRGAPPLLYVAGDPRLL